MPAMEGVNHNKRKRSYEARDKEEIINLIIKKELYKYGDIKLIRKYEKFSSLMI